MAWRPGDNEGAKGSKMTINGGWKGSEEIAIGGYKTIPLFLLIETLTRLTPPVTWKMENEPNGFVYLA